MTYSVQYYFAVKLRRRDWRVYTCSDWSIRVYWSYIDINIILAKHFLLDRCLSIVGRAWGIVGESCTIYKCAVNRI